VKRWPSVDPDLRRRLLREMKRRHNVEARERTAADRIARLDELIDLARELSPTGLPTQTHLDEPPDVWRRMRAHFREASERG